MHDVNRHLRQAQTVKADVQLRLDRAGRAIGGMRALGDNDDLFGHAPCSDPFAQDFFVQTRAINKARVKGIAARLGPSVPDNCAFGQRVAVVTADDQLRDRLRHPCQRHLGNLCHTFGHDAGQDAVGGEGFGKGLIAYLSPPLIQRFSVADAVGKAGRGGGRLGQAVGYGFRDMLCLERKQHARVAQRFGAGFLAHGDVERGIRRPNIAAGHPRIVDHDLPLGTRDDRPIVHVTADGHGDFGDKARGKGQQPMGHCINPRVGQNPRTFHADRVVKGCANRSAGNQTRQRHRIAAHIQYPTPAQGHFVQP